MEPLNSNSFTVTPSGTNVKLEVWVGIAHGARAVMTPQAALSLATQLIQSVQQALHNQV